MTTKMAVNGMRASAAAAGRELQYTRLEHEFSIYNDDIRRSATKTADKVAARQPGRRLQ